MSKTTLVLAAIPPESREAEPLALTPAQAQLRKMVLSTRFRRLILSATTPGRSTVALIAIWRNVSELFGVVCVIRDR
jgi:hypothetical protein